LSSPYVFRTYNYPKNRKDDRFNGDNESAAKVWKVARATSAAPGYFSSQKIEGNEFMDGGVGCNNPSQEICSEIQAVHGKGPCLVLSIGTGTKIENAGSPRRSNERLIKWNVAKRTGPFRHARSMLTLVSRVLPECVANTDKPHRNLEDKAQEAKATEQNFMYFRFNVPDIASKVALDEWIPETGVESLDKMATLRYLEQKTNAYLDTDADAAAMLQECAKELVRVRRQRAETERWERFATHTSYKCPEHDICGLPDFTSREKLRMHASEHHEFVPEVMMENQPVCLIDQCMETPKLHADNKGFIEHLNGLDHRMSDANPMSSIKFEEWLDTGRRTEDAIDAALKQKEAIKKQPQQQNDTSG
jgi:hypothetical protein